MNDLSAYEEQDALGSGGFADVVRAVHLVEKRVVALKKSRTAPDCLARTKREIEVQRLLLQANVMPVLDWALDGSWFTMPVATGDLSQMIERAPVDGAGLLRLVEDVGAGLAAAHRRGYLHRDLSPGNVLWLNDRWVVADWGYVKLPPGQQQTKLSRTGVGTECFTAPEVYRDGGSATPASDVYSLGRIVAWLLIGKVLLPCTDVELDAGSPWTAFVRATTRNDPAERPQTIAAALEFLTPAVQAFSGAVPDLPSGSAQGTDVQRAVLNGFKKLLQDPQRPIELEEFVDRETEQVFERLSPEEFDVQKSLKGAELEARLDKYLASSSSLMSLVIYGCAYGTEAQAQLWTKAVRRIGHPAGKWGGVPLLLSLRYFPTTLLIYAGALAAMTRGHWWNFAAVTVSPILSKTPGEDGGPALLRAAAAIVLERDFARTLPGKERRHTPASDWLFERLREPLRPLIRLDQDYESVFDRLEFLIAMSVATRRPGGWAPPGRFAWKDAERRRFKQQTTAELFRAELGAEGSHWGPVRRGLFRDANEAMAALERVEKVHGESEWL